MERWTTFSTISEKLHRGSSRPNQPKFIVSINIVEPIERIVRRKNGVEGWSFDFIALFQGSHGSIYLFLGY